MTNAGSANLNRDKTKFCPQCAGRLQRHRVGEELRNHWICENCGALHYDSPMLVVKCFVACRNRLLWVRRGIEPRYGLWSIPGGFLESGETLAQGAVREVMEEAGVVLNEQSLQYYMMGAVTFVNQVHIAFRATVDSFECQPGPESLDCRFLTRDECPWNALAYPEVTAAMEQAYDDLECGTYGIWSAELNTRGYDRRLVRET
jgi:ADP-ribose pyrophosphatase YjhB (NUDIX family)